MTHTSTPTTAVSSSTPIQLYSTLMNASASTTTNNITAPDSAMLPSMQQRDIKNYEAYSKREERKEKPRSVADALVYIANGDFVKFLIEEQSQQPHQTWQYFTPAITAYEKNNDLTYNTYRRGTTINRLY